MTTIQGVGHFISWDGGCLLVNRALELTPEHSHYAIQVAFGSENGIMFRTSAGVPWTSYAGAIIPSRQPHAMDATRVRSNAVLFIEPETREGRAIAERYLADGIAEVPPTIIAEIAPPLFAAWEQQRSAPAVTAAARRVVQVLAGGLQPSVVSDARVLRAVDYIKSHLSSPLDLETVAAEAFLSPSRFRHLFVEETGMALRPYILWRRFLHALELVMRGESLSTAAHGAGFADAAHFTRTCRSMFGFPPSAMQFAAPLDDTPA